MEKSKKDERRNGEMVKEKWEGRIYVIRRSNYITRRQTFDKMDRRGSTTPSAVVTVKL